jgi:hypothetical protein
MKTISILGAALLLIFSGCATPQASRRIESSITALDYNSITSTYEKRPTFAELHKLSGKNVLELKMNSYGTRDIWVVFHQNHVAEYLAAIDKFEAWKEIAIQRNEMISREIGKIAAYSGVTLVFTFHAVSNKQFLLQITTGSTGLLGTIPIDRGMEFDSNDLGALKALLKKLPEFTVNSADGIYK